MIPDYVITEVEQRIARIHTNSTTSGRKYHGKQIIELFKQYPELNDYFIFNPNAYYWENLCERRVVPSPTIPMNDIPVQIDNENYSWMQSDEHFRGLYFVGCVGYNPLTKTPIYNVKIGSSDDIAKRMRTYCTHNPMFWHNSCSLKCTDIYENLKNLEWNCHQFLRAIAIRTCPNTSEWFEVTEAQYLWLCNMFSNTCMFHDVAHGKGIKYIERD